MFSRRVVELEHAHPDSAWRQASQIADQPIRRDRRRPHQKRSSFLLRGFRWTTLNDSERVDAPNFSAQTAAIQALLSPKMGTYNIGRDQNVFMAKTDIRLNNSNQLVLRFNQQNFTGNNNENGGALSVQEHSGNSVAKTTTFSGSLTSTLSSRTVNEFRFQVGRDREP